MSPMFSLHSGPTLPLSVPDINAFFSHFGVIMFFWKDPPQTEGRRNAHLLIKTSPGGRSIITNALFTNRASSTNTGGGTS